MATDNNDIPSSESNDREAWFETFSHELIAPLSGLEATADRLINHYESWDEATILAHLRNLQSSARWAARLARNIAWEARKGSALTTIKSQERWTKLKTFLIGCAMDIQGIAASKRMAVHVGISVNDNWQILVDRALFKLAVVNLLDNAVKYAHDNTRVTIGCTSSQSHLIISITNYGIPIFEDEINRIFEVGYRSRAAIETVVVGTGIGLYVARDIVRLHYGDIEVSPSVFKKDWNAHEVIFKILLPLSNVQM